MGFISRLIGAEMKNKGAAWQATQARKAKPEPDWIVGGTDYDPELVGRLKVEHQELMHIFGVIERAAAEGKFHQLPGLLATLKMVFQTHIMLENVKFYAYLQHRMGADPDVANFLIEVRKDMDGIARSLVQFVNTHSATLPTSETAAKFNSELDEIGTMLLWRVKLEESRVYSLYQPGQ